MSELPNPGFNLPHGALRDPRAPWNQDEFEFEPDIEELVDHVLDNQGDAGGGVIYDSGATPDGWQVEIPVSRMEPGTYYVEGHLKALKNGQQVWIVDADHYEEAVSRLVAEREDEITQELYEIEREKDIERQFEEPDIPF